MDYAVSIVMSALKSEVDKSQVTSNYIIPEAIKRRLIDISKDTQEFTLNYMHKKNGPKQFKLRVDDVMTHHG